MYWQKGLNGDPLAWLLETDTANPAIRYFAMRDLLELPGSDPLTREAQLGIMSSGPVPAILEAQHPDGYWEKPGSGYGKYHGTAWQIILLAELGADPQDQRVQRGCEYLLSHTIASNGGFSCTRPPTPNGVIHCLNGNLLFALIQLGFLDDPRVRQALDWQAQAITGDHQMHYYQSSTSGSDFACAANGKQPCAWGATKALKALSAVPADQRSPILQRAIEQGGQFLIRYDLVKANYPYSGKISSAWFKLGFPLSYWSDLLETLGVLVGLGYGDNPALIEVYRWLLSKQDAQGRWKLENSLNGKMWIDIEKKGQPSKWITLRVLRVVKALEKASSHNNYSFS